MNNSPTFTKKPTVCRYFASNGQCFYGDSCQFSHLKNNEEQDEPNNGDAYFNATFKNVQTHFDKSNNHEFTPSEMIQRDDEILMNLNGLMLTSSPPMLPLIPSIVHNYKNGINPAAVAFVPTPPRQCDSSGDATEATPPQFHSPQMPTVLDASVCANHPVPASDPLLTAGLHSQPLTIASPRKDTTSPVFSMQENVRGTTYFYLQVDQSKDQSAIEQCTNMLPTLSVQDPLPNSSPVVAATSATCVGAAPVVVGAGAVLNKNKTNMPPCLTPDELKTDILKRQDYATADTEFADPDIPDEVEGYSALSRLEDKEDTKSLTFGFYTSLYRATSVKDGRQYCLKRIHGFRMTSTKCLALIDIWKNMKHGNIVQLFEVFTTKVFADHSIIFVYAYHPHSFTILEHYFGESAHPESEQVVVNKGSSYRAGKHPEGATLLPESIIWTYTVQLSSALRVIHAHNLSCRVLDPSKIIVTAKARLRVNCVGIFDCLANASVTSANSHYQQDDLLSLGRIVLAFACNSIRALRRDNLQNSLQLVAHNYSADLKNLILYLTTNQSRNKNVNDIMPMIGARFYVQLDHLQLQYDSVEHQLSAEIQNARLFRLICKLGTINERPEYDLDTSWSETGNRYILKLFRDYLFHQVDASGRPWIDMSHIVMTLNKLDAGVEEKICLMSRDEQSVIIASYAEVKNLLQLSFDELLPETST